MQKRLYYLSFLRFLALLVVVEILLSLTFPLLLSCCHTFSSSGYYENSVLGAVKHFVTEQLEILYQ